MRFPTPAAKSPGVGFRLCLILLAALLLAVPAKAADRQEELAEALGLDELEETEKETGLDDFGSILGGYDVDGFLGKALKDALRTAVSPGVLRDLAAVMTTVLLLAAVHAVMEAPSSGIDAASLAGASTILLLLNGTQDSLTALAEATVYKLQDTANVLMPILGSAALLSGQITAAAAKYSAAALFLNVLVNLCCAFVLPLIRLYLAAAAAEAAVGSGVMSGVLAFLKWFGVTVLSVLMLAFTLYLSLTSMTGNTADAAIVRSAKTAMATVLPVVGSIAGDAASSILSAAAMIRQAVGSFGLLAVSSLLLAPFLQTGLRYLLLKGAAAVSEGLTENRISRLLRRLSEAMALTMACIGACGLMLFFSIYSLMRAVEL